MKYSCIYRITTSESNKVYIGSAICFDERVSTHISQLNAHTHKNKHLQAAWDKYGADSFLFTCIEECHPEKLIEREQFWIDFYDAANPERGYNISPIAGNTLGTRRNNESKEKIRQAAMGRKASEETRKQMSLIHSGEGNSMYGRHHSDASKEKMRYLSTGELRSVAYAGAGNPFYGKNHTIEARKKISEKHQGRRTRTKLSTDDVVEIKRQIGNKPAEITYKSMFETLAEKHSVSASCIRKIYRGDRWRDVL